MRGLVEHNQGLNRNPDLHWDDAVTATVKDFKAGQRILFSGLESRATSQRVNAAVNEVKGRIRSLAGTTRRCFFLL